MLQAQNYCRGFHDKLEMIRLKGTIRRVCVYCWGGGGLKGANRNGACACVGGALKGTTRRACGGRALKGTTRRACVRERERECVCVCVSGGDEVHTRTTSHKGGAAEALVAT